MPTVLASWPIRETLQEIEMAHTPGPWKVLEHSWSDTSIVAADVLVKFKFQFSGMAPL